MNHELKEGWIMKMENSRLIKEAMTIMRHHKRAISFWALGSWFLSVCDLKLVLNKERNITDISGNAHDLDVYRG